MLPAHACSWTHLDVGEGDLKSNEQVQVSVDRVALSNLLVGTGVYHLGHYTPN